MSTLNQPTIVNKSSDSQNFSITVEIKISSKINQFNKRRTNSFFKTRVHLSLIKCYVLHNWETKEMFAGVLLFVSSIDSKNIDNFSIE